MLKISTKIRWLKRLSRSYRTRISLLHRVRLTDRYKVDSFPSVVGHCEDGAASESKEEVQSAGDSEACFTPEV